MSFDIKNLSRFLLLFAVCFSLLSAVVDVLTLDGAINPVSSQYIMDGIDRAEQSDRTAIVIQMDTPGGLMSSMEDINKKILNSKVPVLVYIWPSGAKATSAGTFITYASHLAAMAPGTRIGAAHPVTMGIGVGGQESKPDSVSVAKMTNDAVAQIVSFAKMRNRNEEWAEQAIRDASSIDETVAESLGVVEFIASNLREFLELASGCSVEVANEIVVLELEDAELNYEPMSGRTRFLFTITDPNIAYLLLLAGILGIFFELRNPGGIFPGVIGGISLLLAFYAFQMLPINYIGVLLIILGVILLIMEAQVPGIGVLAIGGVVSLVLGTFLLTEGVPDFLSLSWAFVLPTLIVFILLLLFVTFKFAQTKMRQSLTGEEGIVGLIGEVKTPKDDFGNITVFVHSELWTASCDDEVKPGDKVVVTKSEGLRLEVEKKDTEVI